MWTHSGGQEKAGPGPPPWPLAWEPQDTWLGACSPLPGTQPLAGTPRNMASHLCLPFRAPFTSEGLGSSRLDLLPLLLKEHFVFISPRNSSGFETSPCHLPGQAQDARPRTQKAKGRASEERQKAGSQARGDRRSGISGLRGASGLRWGSDTVRF